MFVALNLTEKVSPIFSLFLTTRSSLLSYLLFLFISPHFLVISSYSVLSLMFYIFFSHELVVVPVVVECSVNFFASPLSFLSYTLSCYCFIFITITLFNLANKKPSVLSNVTIIFNIGNTLYSKLGSIKNSVDLEGVHENGNLIYFNLIFCTPCSQPSFCFCDSVFPGQGWANNMAWHVHCLAKE